MTAVQPGELLELGVTDTIQFLVVPVGLMHDAPDNSLFVGRHIDLGESQSQLSGYSYELVRLGICHSVAPSPAFSHTLALAAGAYDPSARVDAVRHLLPLSIPRDRV